MPAAAGGKVLGGQLPEARRTCGGDLLGHRAEALEEIGGDALGRRRLQERIERFAAGGEGEPRALSRHGAQLCEMRRVCTRLMGRRRQHHPVDMEAIHLGEQRGGPELAHAGAPAARKVHVRVDDRRPSLRFHGAPRRPEKRSADAQEDCPSRDQHR
jgi:hypothetical protein